MAALPELQDQWVGIVTKGELSIRPQSENVLIGKLANSQYAQIHDQLPGGWDQHISDKDLDFHPLDISSKPFEIRLKDGAIRNIAVDKSMTNNEVNQLKGVLSQLQVDTQANNLIQCKYNQLPENNSTQAVFKVMEPTVTGKCETIYDVAPLPEYLIQSHREWAPMPELKKNGLFLEIVKTKNFSNCDQRMGYHFGISGANDWKPNTNVMGSALSKSAVSRVIISGNLDSYTIQSSVTTNRVSAKPGQNDQQVHKHIIL